MKRIFLVLASVLTVSVSTLAQRELTISGGNCVSSMVCASARLYVWGQNYNDKSKQYGLLGVGNTTDKVVAKPTEVTYFPKNNLTVKQVNSGSGSHFIAVTCDGYVYAWGNNGHGQCGQGSVPLVEGALVTTPSRVQTGTGDLQGTEYASSDGGYLINVDVVYAGNENSFAILGGTEYKGRLVGWGLNSNGFDQYTHGNGQLGCGNFVNQAYPKFVLNGKTKKPLEGVIQVYAGDNCAYALVDEDGDGVGTVYSWGQELDNGSLGRNANGAGNSGTGQKQSCYAFPVCFADGSPLDNITMLGCGDGAGYGLDVDGYIWAWGNGAWNNSTGYHQLNAAGNDFAEWIGASSIPRKVAAGTTTGDSNDGTYLLAKWVSGGQGFGMAISADNKPVAWGGDKTDNGGITGNGLSVEGTKADQATHYIQYAKGAVHNDVILINRGDTWGWYVRADGSIWAWGNNANGQLGTGNTNNALYATKITVPSNCPTRDPDPSLDLNYDDMTVCESTFNGLTLDAGFILSKTDLLPKYTIRWYKDEVLVSEGLLSVKGTKYKITEPGTYRVELEHTDKTDGGCYEFPLVTDEVTISTYPKTFTEPDEIIFCAEKGENPIIGVTAKNEKAVYSWYASESATKPLATTIGSEQKEADFSSILAANGKYVYVEETSQTSGIFITEKSAVWTSGEDYLNGGNLTNMFATGFYVKESVTITSFNFKANAFLYNAGSETATVVFAIYGASAGNGGYVANTKSYGTFTAECVVATTTQSEITTYEAVGSVSLEPGQYFIVPIKYTPGNNMSFKIKRGGSSLSTSLVDDATGNILQFQSIANGNNPNQNSSGYVYNIHFSTTQGYCDRLAIPIAEECPCSQPKAVTITSSDEDGVLCPGDKSTLTPTKQANATEFAYVWYKGTEDEKNIVAGPSTTDQLTYSVSEEGTYIVKVYDALMPGSSKCQTKAEITLESAENPTVTIGKGADYCETDEIKDIELTFTGTAPFTYTYKENAGTAKDGSVETGLKGSITPSSTVAAGKASSSYEYTIASLSDKYCNAVASGYAGSATVTVGAVPTAEITASDETVCEPSTIKLEGATNVAGATLAWGGDGKGSSDSQTASAAGEYTYTLTATNLVGTKSCKSEEASQTVTINAKPTVTVAAPEKEICSGGDLTVNATAKVGTANAVGGTYEWENAEGTTASVTVSEEATWPNAETVDVSVVYTSEDGCVSDASNKVTLTFNPKPDAPVAVPTISYCTTADPATVKVLEATISTGATATWYLPDGKTSSTAPKPSIASAGTTTYYVTQTKAGCESDKTKIDVVVNAELQPSFIMSADAICENSSAKIELGQADSYISYEWTGDATNYFNGAKIANPTFSGADVTTATTFDFQVAVADKNGCTGKAEGSITVNPVPVATLATDDNEHCISETTAQTITATIEPSMSGTGTWSVATKTTETTATFTPSENAAGTYTVKYLFVSADGCATEKEATQTMIVNALPTPTFTLSNNSVCVSGNNSDAITVTKTNPATGTFAYAIDKGTIDASTGTFNPAGATPGDYTVTLTYTDAKECVNTTTATFTVHDLPTVAINPITEDEICYNSEAKTLEVTVSPAGGNGVWSGAITSAEFNPSKVAVGTNDITYTYTDEFKCQNSDGYTITVKKPAVPTAGEDVNAMINSSNELTGKVALEATSNETDPTGVLQWLVSPIVEGDSYNSSEEAVGSYPYAVRQKITVAGEGCYSDSVIVTLNISQCNAMAPSVEYSDRYICAGTATLDEDFLKATRNEGANPPATYHLAWMTENPVGRKDGDGKPALNIKETTTDDMATSTYKPEITDGVYYVAEYDGVEKCWSAGTKVTVHVVALPEVSVSADPDVCKIGAETIPVTVSPAGGELTANAGTLNGGLWSPGNYYETSDKLAVTFTYEYTTPAYSDEVTCKNTATTNTTAHYMVAPSNQEYTWLIDDIANIPANYVQAELSSTGKTIHWYEDQLMNNSINDGLSLTLDKAALQAAADGQKTLVETYWINQEDEFGCQSAVANVILNLVDCPWEAPNIESVAACKDKTLDNLTAEAGESVADGSLTGNVSNWIWYKEGAVISSAQTETLVHGESTNVAKVVNYEVQYEAVEKRSGKSCKSPKTAVTVTVYPLPEITLDEKETACYNVEEVLINVEASSVNGSGSGTWAIDGDASALKGNAKSAIFYPQANGKISGNYTVTYTYVDEKGCESSKDHKIEVIYLPAPSTVGFYAIASQNNPVIVEAEKTVGDGIVWFEYAASTSDEDKKDFTSSSANKYATGDNPNSLLNTKYYARQYKKGTNDATVTCYSESTPAEVVIMICPVPNVEIENVDSCVYNGNPILTAKPGEWLDADGSRDIASTTYRFYASADGKTYSSYEEGVTNTTTQEGTYEPNLTPTKNPNDAGYYYFYVSEYNAQPYGSKLTNPEGCESSPVKVTVNMKATLAPSISAISASSVCEGDENPSFRVAAEDAKALIYWYEEDEPNPNANGDVDTLAAYGKKAIYKPIGANVGENVVYAVQYVGGCFSPQQMITYTVKPNPVAPDPVENEICYQDLSNDNRVIEAVGDKEKGYSITWYRDNNKAKLLKANSDTYQPADTAVGTYYYYAMQTVDGCSGPVVPVAFTVKPLPVRPVIKEVSRKCTYDEPVLLEAEGMDVLWYAADKETVLNPDERSNTYQTQEEDTTAGKKVYYATQTVEGCEGPMAQVTYMIYKQPEKPNVVGASMCQGDTLVPTLSTDLLLDKWYADEDKETFLVSGYTYTPTVGANEYGNKYFYVQREQNGCFSPIAVDTLVIVQHPVITIEENRIMCVYEELQPIKVQDFVPAVNDRSSVVWRLKNGAVSKYIEEIEGEEHAVAPSDLITEEGTYEVYASYRYVYDNIYCQSDEVSMSIDVKGRARKPIVFTTTICAGDKIEQLRSLGSPNTTWESLDGTLPAEYHGQSYKFQPGQTLDTGVYRYIIYDMNMYDEENLLGCESLRDTVSMVVAPGANTKLFGRDSVCLGSVGETYYTQYESTSQYFWNVTGNNLNYSKDASATSVRYIDWMNVGIDTLTVYEQTWAGCEGFDTLIVRVAPAPIAKFSWTMPGASNIIELTDSTMQDSLWKTNSDGELVAEQIQYTLAWNYGHQGTSETQIDTIVPFAMRHYPLSEGNYLYGFNCPILTVTNDFGCSDTYTECIFVNISSSIYVPTAFSPTNPAHSVRTFQPKGFNLATCEVSVYDKWGNLLWYSDQVEDGIFVGSWDGRYDGKMMKSDVYVWKMEATFLDGQKWQGFDSGNGKKTKFGSVTLIR